MPLSARSSRSARARALPGIDAITKATGQIDTNVKELKQQVTKEFAALNDRIDDIEDELDDIAAQQRDFAAYIANQKARQDAMDAANAKAAKNQTYLATRQAATYLMTTLLSAVDPRAGQAFEVVAEAEFQIADSMNAFLESAAGLGLGDALASTSGLVLTGNIVGAVMKVLPLLAGGPGGSPEQAILEQIALVRKDIADLRQQMNDRFDRVDREIGQVYSALGTQLAKIDTRLGEIHGDLATIESVLLKQQNDLSRFEGNIYAALSAGFRRPLSDAIDESLGYATRTGKPLPFGSFAHFEHLFYAWGVSDAFDSASVGPDAGHRPLDAAHVESQLTEFPLDQNLNYLNALLAAGPTGALGDAARQHPVAPFLEAPAPNPGDWALAARAYGRLAEESPKYARKVPASRGQQLIKVGEELQSALGRLTVVRTADGAAPNADLWDALVENYRRRADAVWQSLTNATNKEINSLGYDPNKDLPDALLREPDHWPPESMSRCDNGQNELPLEPADWQRGWLTGIDRSLLLAKLAGRGDLRFCYSATWDNPTYKNLGADTPCRFPICRVYADLTVHVSLLFRGDGEVGWHTIETKANVVPENPTDRWPFAQRFLGSGVASQTGPDFWWPDPYDAARKADLAGTLNSALNQHWAQNRQEARDEAETRAVWGAMLGFLQTTGVAQLFAAQLAELNGPEGAQLLSDSTARRRSCERSPHWRSHVRWNATSTSGRCCSARVASSMTRAERSSRR